MSVNVEYRVVERGSDAYVTEAWELKEQIRRQFGVLKQRRGFFADAYRRSRVHLYLADDRLIGFASVRRDGYILFLAVDPDFQGEGYGEQLVAEVADDHQSVTCHARTTNQNALAFYQHVGFAIERQIDNYYEDGGDAYFLRLGDADGLAARLSRLIGGS